MGRIFLVAGASIAEIPLPTGNRVGALKRLVAELHRQRRGAAGRIGAETGRRAHDRRHRDVVLFNLRIAQGAVAHRQLHRVGARSGVNVLRILLAARPPIAKIPLPTRNRIRTRCRLIAKLHRQRHGTGRWIRIEISRRADRRG